MTPGDDDENVHFVGRTSHYAQEEIEEKKGEREREVLDRTRKTWSLNGRRRKR